MDPTEEHLLSVSTSVLTNTNLYKMTSSVVQFRFSCAISASLGGLAVLTTAMSMAGGGDHDIQWRLNQYHSLCFGR